MPSERGNRVPPYFELNPQVTPELEALKNGVHEFSEKVLRPAARALDKLATPADVIAKDSPYWQVMRAAHSQNFHTALLPTQLGGLGLSGLSLHIALEELGWGSADFAITLACTGFPYASAAATRNPELIQEVVLPFVADKDARMVGCWAITEPSHGSDHFLIAGSQFKDPALHGEVTARKEGDFYVLNGEKSRWVSNGTVATHAVVHLSLEPGMGLAGGGIAFVPLDLPGITKGAPLDKMGQRGLNQGGFTFKDVRIPARYMLMSDPRQYAAAMEQTLSLTGAVMGAVFTGVARAAFEEALAYTRTRTQGGRPICEHQLVQKHLYDMFVKVESSRQLSRAALIYNQSGAPTASEYSGAAKIHCTQNAFDVAHTAMSLMGGFGLTREPHIEKLFRDTRASLVEDGVNDVLALSAAQKVIARA
jgi:alkylation response protein AidB-like acyl-CoA dehydrogenase